MYGKILVPVDGSETSACGLDEAIKIAGKLGSRIRLVHIMNELIFGGGVAAVTQQQGDQHVRQDSGPGRWQ